MSDCNYFPLKPPTIYNFTSELKDRGECRYCPARLISKVPNIAVCPAKLCQAKHKAEMQKRCAELARRRARRGK